MMFPEFEYPPELVKPPKLVKPHTLSEMPIRYCGDMVLDPVCGSGTTAEAALSLQRRFIVIDMNPFAYETTQKRVQAWLDKYGGTRQYSKALGRHTAVVSCDLSSIPRQPYGNDECNSNIKYTLGDNFILLGDCIAVMRTIPDGAADLIYADPPFNANKEFRNKDGEGFSDIWRWDSDAEARLEEIKGLNVVEVEGRIAEKTGERFGKRERERAAAKPGMLAMQIEMAKQLDEMTGKDTGMASYLSFAALLLFECHRLCGGTEWEPSAIGRPVGAWHEN